MNGIVMLFRDKIKNKLAVVAILSAASYIYSLLIANNAFDLMKVLNINQYIYIIIFLVMPLIFFTFYRVRHSDKIK
jgi:hypothetical protein